MFSIHYNKHDDNSYVEKTVPVMDFISLLIQHIPEKHFKMTRYYGLYAGRRKSDGKLRRAVPKSRHRILLDFNKWRQLFLFLNYTKGQWQNIIAAPVANVLDFIFRLFHTEDINRQEEFPINRVGGGD